MLARGTGLLVPRASEASVSLTHKLLDVVMTQQHQNCILVDYKEMNSTRRVAAPEKNSCHLLDCVALTS